MDHYTIHYFRSEKVARAYRHDNGTGGWIFVPEKPGGDAVLFPPHMPPAHIFRHPAARDRSGRLIGCG